MAATEANIPRLCNYQITICEPSHEAISIYWLKLHHRRLKPEQIKALMNYDYPGNVRELYNLLECADVMDEHDFDKLIADQREMLGNLAPLPDDDDTPDELEATIRRHVRKVFEKYDRNISKTTDSLNVTRNTVIKFLLEK